MNVALITGAYFMLILVSFVGMGNIATKEAFEWATNKPKLLKAASIVCRFKDDIQSNQVHIYFFSLNMRVNIYIL